MDLDNLCRNNRLDTSRKKPEISIIIPVFNEATNIRPLLKEIKSALNNYCDYVVIYVDDGSFDGTVKELMNLKQSNSHILKIIKLNSNYGQSAAIHVGAKNAMTKWVITLDGDGQNNPADIIPMLNHLGNRINKDISLLISGVRNKRCDSSIKKLSSRVANTIRRVILKDNAVDTGCGIKLFHRQSYLALPQFNHMHRFLPALFIMQGGKVEFITVGHRHRKTGFSKYGTLDRLSAGIIDLFGVLWLRKRTMNPIIEDI